MLVSLSTHRPGKPEIQQDSLDSIKDQGLNKCLAHYCAGSQPLQNVGVLNSAARATKCEKSTIRLWGVQGHLRGLGTEDHGT